MVLKVSTVVDDFSTGSAPSTELWPVQAGTVDISAGAARMQATSTGAYFYSGPTTPSNPNPQYDLVASSIYAKITTFPGASGRNLYFIVTSYPSSQVTMRWNTTSAGAGTLFFVLVINGVTAINASVAFNAATMAWWRIRHATSGDTIFMETAPDNGGVPGTWTNQASNAGSSGTTYWTACDVQFRSTDSANSGLYGIVDNVNTGPTGSTVGDVGAGTDGNDTPDWGFDGAEGGTFTEGSTTDYDASDDGTGTEGSSTDWDVSDADVAAFLDAETREDETEGTPQDYSGSDVGALTEDSSLDQDDAENDLLTFAESAVVDSDIALDDADTGAGTDLAAVDWDVDVPIIQEVILHAESSVVDTDVTDDDLVLFAEYENVEFVGRPTISVSIEEPEALGAPNVQFQIGAWSDTGPTDEMRLLSARRVRVSLIDNNEASFSMSLPATAARDLKGGINDLWIRRNGQLLFRGRLFAGGDSFDQNMVSSSYSAKDYRYLLGRRPIGTTITWGSATEQSVIAWALIQRGLDLGNGIPVTPAADWVPTGVTRTYEADGTTTSWQALQTLAALENGFEPYIEPDMTVSLNYPTAGGDNGVCLDYVSGGRASGSVTSINRTVNLDDYANYIRQSGADGTTPVSVGVDGYSDRPEGVWPKLVGDTSLTTNDMVSGAASANLTAFSEVFPEYRATLRQGFWQGPGHLWLGDAITCIIKAGDFDIRSQYRVTEIEISWDSSNVETVSVALSKNSLDGSRRLRDKLNKLEYLRLR